VYKFPKGTDHSAAVNYFRKSGKVTEESEHARQLKGGASSSTRIEDALPPLGATIGGIVGAPGVVTGMAGAALGAGAGEAVKQGIKRFIRHKDYPATSEDAAFDIGVQGTFGAGSELAGQAFSKPLHSLEAGFAKTAARGSRLPLTPAQAGVGGAASRTVEGFLGHAIPSKGIMDEFRAKQLARAGEIVEEEMGRLSTFKGTQEETGRATQKALNESRTRMKGEVAKAYAAIDQLTESQTKRVPKQVTQLSSLVDEFGKPMNYEKRVLEKKQVGGVQPSTRELQHDVIPLLREIQQQKKLIPPQLLADTESLLDRIRKSPDNVTYEAMARSRSDLLAISRKLDEVLPGKRAGIAKLLAKKMDDSMMKAAEDSGISGLPDQIRVANTMTREMHEKFESDLVKKIMESGKPEQVAAYMKSGGLQDIRHLNSLLDPVAQRRVQAAVVQDAFTEAFDPVTKELDPGKFARNIHSLGRERGQELFGENYDNVRQVADLLAKLGPQTGAGMAAGMHNWTYMRAIPVAGAAALFGHPEAGAIMLGGVGAETIFLRKVASALTNPARSARTLHYLALAAHGAPYAVYGLARVVANEGEEDSEGKGGKAGAKGSAASEKGLPSLDQTAPPSGEPAPTSLPPL
jgi:hypothetical protein